MDKLINPDELLNIEQTIDILGITRVTYYEWVKQRKITPEIIAEKPFIRKTQVLLLKEQRDSALKG
jgi:predicted site-specific integrase-resolvase